MRVEATARRAALTRLRGRAVEGTAHNAKHTARGDAMLDVAQHAAPHTRLSWRARM